ncbi:glycerophosphodiester phosphodiesterase family protein [Nocardioides sp. LHG3406-4]|uniref:glycerophosphodiester phosphodiesterase family protein n=1 Tax=Nocardioides sp. LHG3406-4 TaxID=2804575 RepID=UPI003CF583E4
MSTRLVERFDVQAHRGGSGLAAENTLTAFGAALTLGVSTLECDVHVSSDNVLVVSHDREIVSGPLTGRLIRQLTHDELRTVDVAGLRAADFPDRPVATGLLMPEFADVLALLDERGADEVGVNVEIKYDAAAPEAGAPREVFVELLVGAIRDAGLTDRASIQSFDWGALERVRRADSDMRLNLLFNPKYLKDVGSMPSPWLDDVRLADHGGDPIATAAALGFNAVSPIHGTPYTSGIGVPGYRPRVTPKLVEHAHSLGLRVVPYVVDDPATMAHFVDLGVDGLITDYPDRLRAVLADRGERLPTAYPPG